MADGAFLSILGNANFDVTLGQQSLTHEFWVADIETECIMGIGLDFLRLHRCSIDLKTSSLLVEGPQEPSGRCCSITVLRTVTIRGMHEQIVMGRIRNRRNSEIQEGLLEPSVGFHNKKEILVGRALVAIHNGEVPIRVMNLHQTDYTLEEGTTAAILYSVQTVSEANKVCFNVQEVKEKKTTSGDDVPTGDLPEHLVDL